MVASSARLDALGRDDLSGVLVMANVSGPFIEYDCSKCGVAVSEKVHPDPKRVKARILEAETDPDRRICASCWKP